MRRPVVTIHLPLEMGMVAEVLLAIAKQYPAATVDAGASEVTTIDGTTYSTDEGQASIVFAEVEE